MEDIRFWGLERGEVILQIELPSKCLKSDCCIRKVPIGDMLAPLDIQFISQYYSLLGC